MPGVKGQRSGGHNAKTVEQLQAEGTYDPSRHAGQENPLPVPGTPKPPAKLGPIGRRTWYRMIKLFKENRTLSRELAEALFAYCQLFEQSETVIADGQARRARMAAIDAQLPTLTGDSLVEAIACVAKLEQLTAKDAIQIRQFATAKRTYLVEFGFTPAARSRVRMVPTHRRPKEYEQTPLEKLQAAKRSLRAV